MNQGKTIWAGKRCGYIWQGDLVFDVAGFQIGHDFMRRNLRALDLSFNRRAPDMRHDDDIRIIQNLSLAEVSLVLFQRAISQGLDGSGIVNDSQSRVVEQNGAVLEML